MVGMTRLPARCEVPANPWVRGPRSLFALAALAALAGCATAPATPPRTAAEPVAPVGQTVPAAGQAMTPAGFAASVKATSAVQAQAAAPPIASKLFDARYQIDTTASGDAPLKNGLYEETVTGSSGRNVVRLGPDAAYGDLDGDGVDDAAVTLLSAPGGSGAFTYLAAVRDDGGTARPLPSLLLGDRILMKSLAIANGTIRATWLDRAAGEPMSAVPRTEVVKTFAVREGKLEVVGGTPY